MRGISFSLSGRGRTLEAALQMSTAQTKATSKNLEPKGKFLIIKSVIFRSYTEP